MKAKEERKIRTYKAKDKPYKKALNRANKEGNHLASLIEIWINSYSAGYNIISEVPGPGLKGKFP